MADQVWTGLADTISAVRAEIAEAQARRADDEPRFAAGPIELELAIEVTNDGEGRAKVMVLPWSTELKGRRARTRSHRLKVALQPVDEEGNPAKVAGRPSERPE